MATKQDITTQIQECKAARERWQRRLNFAVGKLKKLDAKLKRLERKLSSDGLGLKIDTVADLFGDKADIPPFLDRRDQAAVEQIKAEQAEVKKQKAEIRRKKAAIKAATLEAKQRGDLKRMPLEGKAALAAIRGGS